MKSLNGCSPDEIEHMVAEHVVYSLFDCGYSESDFDIIAVHVFGSRMTDDLYRQDSDLDVLLIYDGDIRDDAMFSMINDPVLYIEGLAVDIFPERERSLEMMVAYNDEYQKSKRYA